MTHTDDKGKQKGLETGAAISDSESSLSSSSSTSLHSDSESEDEITPEYLESLLEKARQSMRAKKAVQTVEEDILVLEDDDIQRPLPPLDPGELPPLYFEVGKTRLDGPSFIRDPDVEKAGKASSSRTLPSPAQPPPELTKSGKPLTKKQLKEIKTRTAGPDWFNMPAPSEADLPRIYREVEALRLRNHLDPKRFYRKDEGETKGIKGLPKFIALGTILPSKTPFGTASADNLTRTQRKRTIVDELVDDAEAKRYAKKKFQDLQAVRGARGKNTLRAKRALRQPKF